MSEPTREEVEAAIANDRRFAVIDMGAAVAAELRDSNGLKLFLASLRREAEDALVEFADANIANMTEIVPLQVKVRSIVFLNRTIEQLMAQAATAEQQILSESERHDFNAE